MITMAEIQEQIRRSLGGRAAGVQLGEKTSLQDIGLSSMQISEILFRLEEAHGIEFDTARAAEVQTLGDLFLLGAETSPA